MGLLGNALAAGIASGTHSLSRSIDQQQAMDFRSMLERSRQMHAENLARLNSELSTNRAATERQWKNEDRLVGVDENGLPVRAQDQQSGKAAMNPKLWEKGLPMSDEERAKYDKEMTLLDVQGKTAEARLKREESMGSTGSGKGKWVQDADGNWQFLQAGDTAQGTVKEDVKQNDDGTLSVYDPGSGTARTVYTEDQAMAKAEQDAAAWAEKKSEGMFNFKPGEKEIEQFKQERYRQLIEGSQRKQKGGGQQDQEPAKTTGNNNVGNMRPPGSSTGFQQFGSVEESISAIDKQLRIYGERDKVDTLEGVISKWSPPNENDTQALIANASKVTGIKPGQKIDLSNPAVRTMLTAAIIRQEGNGAYKAGINVQQQKGGMIAQAQQPASQPAPLPKTKELLEPGRLYTTKRGPAIWDGEKFVQ